MNFFYQINVIEPIITSIWVSIGVEAYLGHIKFVNIGTDRVIDLVLIEAVNLVLKLMYI